MNAAKDLRTHPGEPEVYEHAIPAFAPAELERLYGNTFSSFLAEHVEEDDTSTYVARAAGEVAAILLFKLHGRRIQVLNAAIRIDPEQLLHFASCMFARYPAVKAISLVSVASGELGQAFPCQRFRSSEDYLLSLPPTVEAYDATLGKATAAGLRTKQNRLRRDVPGVSFQVHEGSDIDDAMLEAVFSLKNGDESGRGRLDDAQQAWLRKVARTHGFLGVTRVDGRIRAATLSTRIGVHLFLHVLAHDRAFDSYSLGMLNAYLSVCAGIRHGATEFHFLWGAGVWKKRLKAVELQLEDIVVYRSHGASLACPDLLLRSLVAAHWRRLRLGMLAAGGPESRYAWLVRPCLNGWCRFKGALA